MKIRTGFVSNSSSSSFVCIGFKYDKEKLIEVTKEEVIKELGEAAWANHIKNETDIDRAYDYANQNYSLVVSEEGIIGMRIDGVDKDIRSFTIQELIEKIKELEEHNKKLGTGEEIKLFFGEYRT